MPRGNGTGPPGGSGPGSGRGLGKCGAGIRRTEGSGRKTYRMEDYLVLPAMLISFASMLGKLFRKPQPTGDDQITRK